MICMVGRGYKIACGDLVALLLTQEAPSRLRRNSFVFTSAICEQASTSSKLLRHA